MAVDVSVSPAALHAYRRAGVLMAALSALVLAVRAMTPADCDASGPTYQPVPLLVIWFVMGMFRVSKRDDDVVESRLLLSAFDIAGTLFSSDLGFAFAHVPLAANAVVNVVLTIGLFAYVHWPRAEDPVVRWPTEPYVVMTTTLVVLAQLVLLLRSLCCVVD
jgi:hypothetical protein